MKETTVRPPFVKSLVRMAVHVPCLISVNAQLDTKPSLAACLFAKKCVKMEENALPRTSVNVNQDIPDSGVRSPPANLTASMVERVLTASVFVLLDIQGLTAT